MAATAVLSGGIITVQGTANQDWVSIMSPAFSPSLLVMIAALDSSGALLGEQDYVFLKAGITKIVCMDFGNSDPVTNPTSIPVEFQTTPPQPPTQEFPTAALSSGVLTIQGTPYNDSVQLPASTTSKQYVIFAKKDDAGHILWQKSVVFEKALIQKIVADLGDGNNYFSNATAIPALVSCGSGNDQVIGGAGNDTIYGGSGIDNLSGRGGNDLIEGGPGNDYLYGNDGDDTLRGGPGDDRMTGGAGTDAFEDTEGTNIVV